MDAKVPVGFPGIELAAVRAKRQLLEIGSQSNCTEPGQRPLGQRVAVPVGAEHPGGFVWQRLLFPDHGFAPHARIAGKNEEDKQEPKWLAPWHGIPSRVGDASTPWVTFFGVHQTMKHDRGCSSPGVSVLALAAGTDRYIINKT
jgi:hypothetical protein